VENIVFLKAYRNVEDITAALKETGMLQSSIAISRCSRDDEEIIEDVMELRERKPDYWTLIMAKSKQ
jgi:precorrin-2/cobalt-factor-2 C20-methyltransferase